MTNHGFTQGNCHRLCHSVRLVIHAIRESSSLAEDESERKNARNDDVKRNKKKQPKKGAPLLLIATVTTTVMRPVSREHFRPLLFGSHASTRRPPITALRLDCVCKFTHRVEERSIDQSGRKNRSVLIGRSKVPSLWRIIFERNSNLIISPMPHLSARYKCNIHIRKIYNSRKL